MDHVLHSVTNELLRPSAEASLSKSCVGVFVDDESTDERDTKQPDRCVIVASADCKLLIVSFIGYKKGNSIPSGAIQAAV